MLGGNPGSAAGQPAPVPPAAAAGAATRAAAKTKVMFIVDFIYGVTGGTENQLAALLRNLDRARYDVFLVSLRSTPWLAEHGRSLDANLRCFQVNKLRHPGTLPQLVRLGLHIRRVAPHVVVTYFPVSNIFGVLAARLAGATTIWTTRRDYGVWFNCAFRGDLRFLKFASRYATGIITNSRKVRELVVELEGCEPSRIRVIYNGIDPATCAPRAESAASLREELAIPAAAPVVGIVAGLRPMKRHETFLRAAREILARRPGVHFVVVGDGPRRQHLEVFTRELGIEANVHFVGWQQEIARYLALFAVGVNCSANEGLSNAIMEYLAAGIACIVSEAGGNPELVEHGVNGYLYPLDEVETLAALALRLLDDGVLRRTLGENARSRMRREFGIGNMVEAYERLFTQASVSPGRGRGVDTCSRMC